MATAVDRIYDEYDAVIESLKASGEISLASAIDANARKSLLLAAASYFEAKIGDDVVTFCEECVNNSPILPSLVRKQVFARNYHTLFAWDAANANAFFAQFGVEFKEHMKNVIKENEGMADRIRDFMQIGSDRNRLVHQDFATFSLEKTTREIYELYKSATQFVDAIKVELHACHAAHTAE